MPSVSGQWITTPQVKEGKNFFEENNDTLIPVYLPTASPEFMVMEEVWNVATSPACAKFLSVIRRF